MLGMVLDSFALEAFHAVAQHGTFTFAAQNLNITQSALSQRISGLEKNLGTTLFLRQKQGAILTPAGRRLLVYVQAKGKLEEELVGELVSTGKTLEGTIRLIGFSSIVRSILIPALSPLLSQNPNVRLELQSREISEISECLLSGETDFALHFEAIAREGIVSEHLGDEEYVLAEAKRGTIPEVFLDHHEDDEISLRYLRKFDPSKTKILRRYLDDAYGLIDGVAWGLGRAVLPKHLIKSDERIRILNPSKVLKVPIYLNFFTQPYYTKLQMQTHEAIREGFRQFL